MNARTGPAVLSAEEALKSGAAARSASGSTVRSLRNTQDSATMSALGTANGISNMNILATQVGAGAFGLSALSGGVRHTLGRLPYVGAHITDAAGAMFYAPGHALQRTTLGNLGDFGRHYREGLRGYSALHGTMKSAPNAAQLVEDMQVGRAGHASAQASAQALTSGAFGDSKVAQYYARRARSGLLGLDAHLQDVQNCVHDGGHWTMVRQGRDLLRGLGVGWVKPLPELSTMPSEIQHLHGEIEALRKVIQAEPHLVDIAQAERCVVNIRQAAQKAAEAGHINNVSSLLGGGLADINTHLGEIGGHMSAARGTESTLGTIGRAFKGMSLYNALFKGGLIAGVGYFGLRTISSASQAITYFKEMHQDVTGQPASTWQIISGSGLDPMMKQARSNLFANFGPEAVVNAISGLTNMVFMSRNPGMVGQGLLMGTMMVPGDAAKMAPKQYLLDCYIMVKDMANKGIHVPAEAYGALIEAASAEARKVGGVKDRLVQGLAIEYETAQMNPADVLKEIAGKTAFHARAKRVADAIVAEDKLHPAKKPAHNKPLISNDHTHAAQPSHTIASSHLDPLKAQQAATGIPTMIAASNVQHDGKLMQLSKQVGA